MECKGISIDDKNITYVKLPSGTYLIDDNVIKNDAYYARFQCNDPTSIRKITENKYIKEYTDGTIKMSVQKYNENKCQLEGECLDKHGFNSLYG